MNSIREDLCHTWLSLRTKMLTYQCIGVSDARQKTDDNIELFRHPSMSRIEYSRNYRHYSNSTRSCFLKLQTKSFTYLLSMAFGAVTIVTSQARANERLNTEQFSVVAENCASSINPDILSGLVSVESRFHPYAIGVGGSNPRSIFPKTKAEAVEVANQLIANGERFDAGIAQINIQNFDWLELTVPRAFDVCANLTAAETVLREAYDRSRAAGKSKTDALRIAISTYNSGHSTAGVQNGYVGKVMRDAGISTGDSSANNQQSASTLKRQTPRWDVYGKDDTSSAIVFN